MAKIEPRHGALVRNREENPPKQCLLFAVVAGSLGAALLFEVTTAATQKEQKSFTN